MLLPAQWQRSISEVYAQGKAQFTHKQTLRWATEFPRFCHSKPRNFANWPSESGRIFRKKTVGPTDQFEPIDSLQAANWQHSPSPFSIRYESSSVTLSRVWRLVTSSCSALAAVVEHRLVSTEYLATLASSASLSICSLSASTAARCNQQTQLSSIM